ncbi:gp436 family protein [Paraburkholderia sp.]|uniref:gp436 family protein n=1 Tax=Paraburkholderia sp. TaxID=1926495 RepID=UPI002D28533A|nr:phage protein Gp36 family protein [Paraburkholderia sp.]HZZ04637.1 phage protein Gp36 family protein [Paraburkholderia sp.]
MYATADIMTARFGQREVLSLSDRDRTGEINATVLSDALDDASSEIDTYLAGRYALPLDPAPKMLAGICCDIARYRLCGGETVMTEEIRQRYTDAVRFLRLVASGEVTLGANAAGAVAEPDNSIQFVTGTRVFGRDSR